MDDFCFNFYIISAWLVFISDHYQDVKCNICLCVTSFHLSATGSVTHILIIVFLLILSSFSFHSSSLTHLPEVLEMWLEIVKFNFWMKSTRWRNQELVLSRQQMDNLNVCLNTHTVKTVANFIIISFERILQDDHIIRSSSSFCLNMYMCVWMFPCIWIQGRVGQSVSTARLIQKQNVASAPDVCVDKPRHTHSHKVQGE